MDKLPTCRAYLELVLAGLVLRAWVEKVNGESLGNCSQPIVQARLNVHHCLSAARICVSREREMQAPALLGGLLNDVV